MTLKVLLIDDHMLCREGLISLLQHRNIEVLAAVGDGNEGIRLVQEMQPDIVLLDKRMPIIDGISVLKHLKKIGLQMPIVMLTTSSNEQDLLDALKAGASGYLLKDMEPDGLVSALRDIHAGKTVVAPPLTSVLVRFVKGDDIWLSPFYQRDTCSIAVHRYFEEDFTPYFKSIEPIFRKYNGRPHWGKLNTLSRDDFRQLYPKWDDFSNVRRELDPLGRFLNPYLRELFT